MIIETLDYLPVQQMLTFNRQQTEERNTQYIRIQLKTTQYGLGAGDSKWFDVDLTAVAEPRASASATATATANAKATQAKEKLCRGGGVVWGGKMVVAPKPPPTPRPTPFPSPR